MGVVYGGLHTALNRPIAVKVMRLPPGTAPGFAERFKREAFATARLDHPHCVGVLDCGTTPDGRPFIVMPRIEGISLRALLDREPKLAPARAMRIVRQVVEALGHAHAASLVHRDVKPANIMLSSRDGIAEFAVLLDFGVVKLIGDAHAEAGGNTITQAGFAIGSPTYMSPEQVAGGEIDGRSDLYSVSMVLYEMLAGAPPFLADDPLETVRKQLTEVPQRIEKAAAGVELPLGLAELIHRNLAKNASDRPANAAEYLQHLDRILAMLPADAGAPGGLLPTDAVPTAALPAARLSSPVALETAGFPVRGEASGTGSIGHDATVMAQSAAPSPTSNRRSILLIGGVAALAIVIAIVIALRSSPGDQSEPSEQGHATESMVDDTGGIGDDVAKSLRRTAVADIPALADVHADIEADRRDAAIKALHRLRSDYPNHAYLPLLHGTLFLDRLWRRDGIDAYRAAVALEPRLRESPTVIRSVVWSLRAVGESPEATKFLIEFVGERAMPFLDEAMEDPNKNVRARVEKVRNRVVASLK